MAPAPLRPSAALAFALGLAALVILLDQITKWLILGVVMVPPRTIEVTGFFNLVLVFNTGVSFGLFGGEAAWKPYAFGLLALAVSGGLLVWLWRNPQRLPAFAVGLIIGGALGNVIDRLRFAAVVDFLDFHLAGWHWPAFNLADAAITLGVALLVVDGLFLEGRRGKKA
ncbi:MAG TPA: signal peptidase II [Kiloniellales bacterium]|nr:signal peptidase II [Kiloniellales bacterium]